MIENLKLLFSARRNKLWYIAYFAAVQMLANAVSRIGFEILGTDEMAQRTVMLPVLILQVVLYVVGILIVFCDFDAIIAFFIDYKKSSYYHATGVKRRELLVDEGLMGEFNAYLLSRRVRVPHSMLYNVCVPMPNGNFQEVDAVLITNNSLYVIECKNRGGQFVGSYDQEKWVQYIGRQEHSVNNIYLQNQGHVMAIEQLLLSKGVIPNGTNACFNTLLTLRPCGMPKDKHPYDFCSGERFFLANEIEKMEKILDDSGSADLGNSVYETLLPYALYSTNERTSMMNERTLVGTNSNWFTKGKMELYRYDNGIPGITNENKVAYVRCNHLYAQLRIEPATGETIWQTRTDLPLSKNHGKYWEDNTSIAKGVAWTRVQAYKDSIVNEPKGKEWNLIVMAGAFLLAAIWALINIFV